VLTDRERKDLIASKTGASVQKKTNVSKNDLIVSTTAQLILNMTDKVFVYYKDVNNSQSIEYINRLPKNYAAKIRVIIKETEKNIKNKKKRFTKKYLHSIYNKFNYDPLKHKNKHNKTKKNTNNKS
jgi:hypothetical protein